MAKNDQIKAEMTELDKRQKLRSECQDRLKWSKNGQKAEIAETPAKTTKINLNDQNEIL